MQATKCVREPTGTLRVCFGFLYINFGLAGKLLSRGIRRFALGRASFRRIDFNVLLRIVLREGGVQAGHKMCPRANQSRPTFVLDLIISVLG